MPSPTRVGLPQSVKGLDRTKRLTFHEYQTVSPAFGLTYWLFYAFELKPKHWRFLSLEPLDWNYTIGSASCSLTLILGLISLHNCMSQFLLINPLPYVCVCVCKYIFIYAYTWNMNVEMYIHIYMETISVYGNIYTYTQSHTHFLLVLFLWGALI